MLVLFKRKNRTLPNTKISTKYKQRTLTFAANDVAIGPVSNFPFRTGFFRVAGFRRRRPIALLDAAVALVDEGVDVAAEQLSTKHRAEADTGRTASLGAFRPLADVPIGRARVRVARAVVLRLEFRFAETLLGHLGRVEFDAGHRAHLKSAAAGARAGAPAGAADVPREAGRRRVGVIRHPLVQKVQF